MRPLHRVQSDMRCTKIKYRLNWKHLHSIKGKTMTSEKQTTLKNRIQSIEERLKQLKMRERQLQQRLKTIESQKSRRDETRKKIIVGAITLQEMGSDPSLKAVFLQKLDAMLKKPSDRKLFNLRLIEENQA